MFHGQSATEGIAIVAVAGHLAEKQVRLFRAYASTIPTVPEGTGDFTTRSTSVAWEQALDDLLLPAKSLNECGPSMTALLGFPQALTPKLKSLGRIWPAESLADALATACGMLRARDCNMAVVADQDTHSTAVGMILLKRVSTARRDCDTVFCVIHDLKKMDHDALTYQCDDFPEMMMQAEQSVGYFDAEGVRLPEALDDSPQVDISPPSTATADISVLLSCILGIYYRQIPPETWIRRRVFRLRQEHCIYFPNLEFHGWLSMHSRREAGVVLKRKTHHEEWLHVSLSDTLRYMPPDVFREWHLLPMSADTPTGLSGSVKRFANWISTTEGDALPDIAFTLQTGRGARPFRSFAVCRDVARIGQMQLWKRPSNHSLQSVTNNKILFMFPGEKSVFLSSGRELYDSEPLFAERIDECAEILLDKNQVDIRDLLYPEPDDAEKALQVLHRPAIAQSVTLSIGYALSELWHSWGVRPTMLIGHDVGEITAATVAGVFSLPDALELCLARGAVLAHRQRGVLLTARISIDTAKIAGIENIRLVAVHAPELLTLAGPPADLEALKEQFLTQGVRFQECNNTYAYQAPLTVVEGTALASVLKAARLSPPQIPLVSTLSGDWLSKVSAMDPAYWLRQFSEPLRFADGLQKLHPLNPLYLEVGAHSTLGAYACQSDAASRQRIFSSLGNAIQDLDNNSQMLQALGRLWTYGTPVNWRALYAFETRHYTYLPGFAEEAEADATIVQHM